MIYICLKKERYVRGLSNLLCAHLEKILVYREFPVALLCMYVHIMGEGQRELIFKGPPHIIIHGCCINNISVHACIQICCTHSVRFPCAQYVDSANMSILALSSVS